MSQARELVQTTCPYCGVGCGMAVRFKGEGLTVSGDRSHPANGGRRCAKGVTLADTLSSEGRLLHPLVGGQRVSWEQALAAVSEGLQSVIERHGAQAVAMYVSGQLLTEDYYVANKLMKGFIGSPHIDTNSRLCMASAVAGHQRAFGADVVPGCYEDIELADLVVIVGSNTAWCHPVLFQRLSEARAERGTKVVVIDPRRTATCEIADLHLPLRPGSDIVLFNGLLAHLALDAIDEGFIADHTEGFETALAAAVRSAPSIGAVAAYCGLALNDVARFYDLFAHTERTVTLFSQGINQSICGTDQVNAILNLHLATGRVGKPGMGPFSLTGQPNAMGGREAGAMANQLAAHMGYGPQERERVARFWGVPEVAAGPGLKAVELFQAVAAGRIRAIWIMGTNPVVSLPDADAVRAALKACDLVVVSDCARDTETTRCAHILLPAAGWGEKSGTVTNSERRISRQRAFVPPLAEARLDWWIISQVAQRMGFANAFDYPDEAAIFREHARLSGFENSGARAFDISALAELTDREYRDLTPLQWPVTASASQGTPRLFGDGRFFTASGKAGFVPVAPLQESPADPSYPLVFNTGRLPDQWHTMTRTGNVPQLAVRHPEPFVEIHPHDASAADIEEGGWAMIESPRGRAILRAHLTERQRQGSLFAPIHWSGVNSAVALVNGLVAARVDAISGQPDSKRERVKVYSFRPRRFGVLLTRHPVQLHGIDYWTRVRRAGLWCYRLATRVESPWPEWGRAMLGSEGEWIEYSDRAMGDYRAGLILGEQLVACLSVTCEPLEGGDDEWLFGIMMSNRTETMLRERFLMRPDQG